MTQLQHTRYMQLIRGNCFEWHQPGKNNRASILGGMRSFSVINDNTIIWPWCKQLC